MDISASTPTEERALALLGQGYSNDTVTTACGVTPSRISQLLSRDDFKNKVAELKFANLQVHNALDTSYDTLETKLVARLNQTLPLMLRPGEILNAIKVINGAKRRGSSAPEQQVAQASLVTLVLPVAITQQFTTNVNNQVIQAGEQTLVTMPSGRLLKLGEDNGEANTDQCTTVLSS